MVKIRHKKTEILEFTVDTTEADKEEGKKRDPKKCMYKVSGTRALYKLFPEENNHHRVRVDAGHIRFIHDGYRYVATTPKLASSNLKKFDGSLRCKECKRSAKGFCRRHDTIPHQWVCKAVKDRKIVSHKPFTKERQNQINAARRDRIAAGKPDKYYSLRQRVVGYA
jgi:hypothetical protein